MATAMTVTCFAACGKKDDSTESGPGSESQKVIPTDGSVYNDFKTGGTAIIGNTTELTGDDLGSGEINVLNLLVRCGLCASKGEARRLVQQGGVTVGDKKVDSIDASFGCQEFTGDGLIIRKGKKVFHRAVLI